MPQEFDIIGDIHGRADALEAVLLELGYIRGPRGYEHPEGRKVLFLGDFLDRGPQEKRAIDIVREMVDSGNAYAIMGNHEFNAICYATLMPDGQSGYIRPHTEENTHGHRHFLGEYPFGSPEYKDVIAWFKTLPVYIETDEFRIIHACWDDRSLPAVRTFLDGRNVLTDEAYAAYARGAQPFRNAIDMLLCGPEQELPDGVSYADPQGKMRTAARQLWWKDSSLPVQDRLNLPLVLSEPQAGILASSSNLRDVFMQAAKPTFIGHYGLRPENGIEISKDVAMLDYAGQVTGYRRRSGDGELSRSRIVFCPQ